MAEIHPVLYKICLNGATNMTYYSDIQPTDFAGQTSSICLQTKQVGENCKEVFW